MALAPGGRFVVEDGEDGAAVADTQPSMLQESERDILYFQEFFVGQRTEGGRTLSLLGA